MTAGVFTSAPPGQPQHPMHTLAFSMVFIPLGVAGTAVGIRLVRTMGWRAFARYSVVARLLMLAAALGNLASQFSPAPQTPISSPSSQQVLGGYGGVANRVMLVLAVAWYVVLAVRMLRAQGRVR